MIQMSRLANSFFTYEDKSIDNLIYTLEPLFWWSRRYEYPFALQFIKKNHIVLDSCCGLEHPFKFGITDKCKEVYAFDLEDISFDNIKNAVAHRFGENAEFTKDMYDKLKFTQCNIAELPYPDSMFDIVACISSMEHIDKNTILQGLQEFQRVLKPDGRAILTCDYPTIMPTDLIELAEKSGLSLDGEYDYSIPQNAITTNYFGGTLFCYSMVLKKKGEIV